ncbi:hypothetical protein DB35_03045 [Streptomyces abyssalis]|uniref:Uncharacterized protein n=1 Tax=Streptomyces abyssalis TaxID=933944 RepID=A0A1E7JPR2_9ACTN|nr:DUF6049 family protein [Streptomyces abyssalis]OEU90269.1 hypothetical protein AN215_12165 [Streptomyces abyssalis]OEU95004.1 hypothetical protein DB35_03045 [Streptomyces abyssalis]
MAEAAENQGTPTAPARRLLRGTAAVLLTTGPLLGGLLPPPAAAADTAGAPAAASAPSAAQSHARSEASAPAPARKGTGSQTADISVNTLSPATPQKGDTVSITGTVTNNGRSSISDGRIGLRIGPGENSRSALEQNAGRKDYLPGADGKEVEAKRATTDVGSMRPGIRRSFKLKLPVSALKMDSSGVYQLGVTLTGQTRERPYDQILGIERSFLPWQTSDAEKKTGLTYLWPLISSSHLTARTQSDEAQTPVFRNDELAKELAPGGRLQQMVNLGKDLPITWMIDPDLLASVDAMTERYRVQKKGGGTVAGKGQAYAKQWLMDLQGAVKGEEVATLPFADPDVASLAHRGRNVPGALGDLGSATKRATETVETILHTKPSTDYAWPVEGAVDPGIVDVATSAGAHNVIARSDSLRDTALSYTPTSARPIGGGNTALVADARLSKAFEGDMTRPGATSRAVQRFLGETQAVTAQVPNKQRNILVAPQRTPSASQARAMALALSSLQKDGRWVEGSDLSEAAKAKPDPGANGRVPSSSQYPASLRKKELPAEAYRHVQNTKRLVGDFKKILTREDRVVTPFASAVERGQSTSWRGDAEGASNYRDGVRSYLVGLTKEVRLIQKSPITLSGRSATIPVTVQNNLVQGVENLELRLTSRRRIGLDVGEPKAVRIDGEHSQSVKFPTTSKANGRAFVEAQLYTKDGKPYGKRMVFQVNVTSITSTVLLVIAGGVLLVVLAGVRMYTTRKRNGGTAPGQDPSGPDEDEGDSDSGPGADGTDGAEGVGEDDGGERPDPSSGPAEPDEADQASPAVGTGESAGSDGRTGAGGNTGKGSGSVPDAGEKVDR